MSMDSFKASGQAVIDVTMDQAEADFYKKLKELESRATPTGYAMGGYAYDKDGKILTKKTTGIDRGKSYETQIQNTYDEAGNLVSEEKKHGHEAADRTEYKYEGSYLRMKTNGRVSTIFHRPDEKLGGADFQGRWDKHIIVTRDGGGRIVKEEEIRFNPQSDDGPHITNTTEYEYDLKGRLLNRRKGVFASDSKNKLLEDEIRSYGDSADGSYRVTITKKDYDSFKDAETIKKTKVELVEYDRNGNIISRKNPMDANEFELNSYDARGNQVKQVQNYCVIETGMRGGARPTGEIVTRFTTTAYDDHGNVLTSETRVHVNKE